MSLSATPSQPSRLPLSIWVLGFVSLLPVYMVLVLGASGLAGILWAWGGVALTFQTGAGLGALVIVLLWTRRK